jgi:hypothetical protein
MRGRPTPKSGGFSAASADCPLFIGRAPEPDQTIDLKARPHLTIG